MPTPRQYQFDIDTKRYLNRVNTYRQLNGRPNIQNGDAADIDNFVIGLKDLEIWPYFVEGWTLPAYQNISTGSTVISFLSEQNNGTLVNSPIWNNEGIQVTANNQQINLNSSPITFGFPFCVIAVYRMHTNTSITSDSFRFYGFPNNETQAGMWLFSNTSGGGRDYNVYGYGGVVIGTSTANYNVFKNRNEFQIIGQSFEYLAPNNGAFSTNFNNAFFNTYGFPGTTNSYNRTTDLYTLSSPASIFYSHANANVNTRTLNSLFLFRTGLKFSQMSSIRNVLLNSILKKQTVIT